MGETDKPVPKLTFYDSAMKISSEFENYNVPLDGKMMDSLSDCAPLPDNIEQERFPPMYKLTFIRDSSLNIIYIISPKKLINCIDCIQKYITEKDFYIPYNIMESVKRSSEGSP